jgi:soluble lytic murein transglycosylase-like protein
MSALPVLRFTMSLTAIAFAFVAITQVRACASDKSTVQASAPVLLAQAATAPSVLSSGDVERYQRILALQDDGDMKKADALIAELENKILMGHVLRERYLHPAWKSTFDELNTWMDAYADLPGADDIYDLARARQPKKLRRTITPPLPRERRNPPDEVIEDRGVNGKAIPTARKVQTHIEKDRPTQAIALINGPKTRKQLSDGDYDVLMNRIAWSYYIEKKNDEAYKYASQVANRRRDYVPLADWVAGLAAYRLKNFAGAAEHFSYVARADVRETTRSGGAFWAARSYLMAKQPEKVTPMLELAAKKPRTFYGLIAIKMLGKPMPFEWKGLGLDENRLTALRKADRAVDRSIALTQIARRDIADQELYRVHSRVSASHDPALAGLAQVLDLPATQLHVASEAANPDAYMTALYPIPSFAPENGFQFDRALIFAFVRAESRFKLNAKSSSGAVGLMQIMPATAASITGNRSFRRDTDPLYEPGYNMRLGQQYLQQMMAYGQPDGNLFVMATAYNGGPGNTRRWLNEMDYQDDPLLYVESIPARETRDYIEKVLANMWIYHHRLGQPAPTLEAVAAGGWPTYKAVEGRSFSSLEGSR